jgi:hypothetical protein
MKRIDRKAAFLKAYRITGTIRGASKACRQDESVHYAWLKSDPNYRVAFDATQDEIGQVLEDEAVRRAHEGVKRTMYYKGKPLHNGRKIAYEVEYSDQLLLALLKRFRPEKYRERTTTEHTGSINLVERLTAARQRLIAMKRDDTDKPTGTA